MTDEAQEGTYIWDQVCQTDPRYTRDVSEGGLNYTAIDPMSQMRRATEMWGPYGRAWGLRKIAREVRKTPDGTNEYCLIAAEFFYPGAAFEIANSILLSSKVKKVFDADWVKKIETNTISKALSRLGFNADVFLGKFEDERYVRRMRDEFAGDAEKISDEERQEIEGLIEQSGADVDKFCAAFAVDRVEDLPADSYKHAVVMLNRKLAGNRA